MSLAAARTQIYSGLQAVTWTVPASVIASNVPILKTQTAYASVWKSDWTKELKVTDVSPTVRFHLKTADEASRTSGPDGTRQYRQFIDGVMWIDLAVESKFSVEGTDFMDAVVDATLTYFRRHTAGPGGTPTVGNPDILLAISLAHKADLAASWIDGLYHRYRATLSTRLQFSVV